MMYGAHAGSDCSKTEPLGQAQSLFSYLGYDPDPGSRFLLECVKLELASRDLRSDLVRTQPWKSFQIFHPL